MDMSAQPRRTRAGAAKASARPRAKRDAPPPFKPVSLALQGGGAHGAFAWGVLDRLIEDGRLRFEGISATSAGAMNAAVLASGWLQGGPEGARQALASFWRSVSEAATRYTPGRMFPWLPQLEDFSLEHSPAYLMMEMATRLFSPYQLNPMNVNPLRDVLEAHVDFAGLRQRSPIRLFLAATNVETCKMRIFKCEDISASAVLASACLPFVFQAVEIEGEFYWDGGFLGNPAIFPLIYEGATRDIVIVHLNPIVRRGCPRTAGEILNRLNEVSFNASLMREMRAIAYVTSLIERGKLAEDEARRIYIHAIRADDTMARHGAASKFNLDWGFLCRLRDDGREHAGQWLAQHFERLGQGSSVEVGAEYL